MTPPVNAAEKTAASTPTIIADDAAVFALDIPVNAYMVRAERGKRETVITEYDLSNARVGGSPVVPAWTDPQAVIEAYGLRPLVETCDHVLREMFGNGSSVRPAVEHDPESRVPSLVLWLSVPRAKRNLRHGFLGRYARETVIPSGAPVPVLLWEYEDAVPA